MHGYKMTLEIQSAKTLRIVKEVGRKRGGKRDPRKRAPPRNLMLPWVSVLRFQCREKKQLSSSLYLL